MFHELFAYLREKRPYQYTDAVGSKERNLEWEKSHKKELVVHKTQIFKEKMKEANDNGIGVVEALSADETHQTDNIQARYVLEASIGESENSDIEVLEGK